MKSSHIANEVGSKPTATLLLNGASIRRFLLIFHAEHFAVEPSTSLPRGVMVTARVEAAGK